MKRVLIVDSDLAVCGQAKQALSATYSVSTADSAERAFGFLSDHNPDLILMTSAINGSDSIAFLKLIRRIPGMGEIPIIVLTGQGDSEIESEAFKNGVADIITKPFTSALLLNRVDTQLELAAYRTNALEFIGYQDALSVSIAELVECRDITTGGHLKNTTAYFKLLLEEIISLKAYKDFIPAEDVRDLIRSAPLHDIGKIGINDDILRKSSTLDYSEFEYMKTHTILGKETFEKIMKETGETRFLQLARDLAYCHHERWDGSGYPNGMKGEEIPFYARILTIADVYDALTSRRTYKEAYSHKEAVKIIRDGKGIYFDPELVDIFMKINDRFEQAQKNKYRKSADE
ncbi:MAG TPA: HD domain-containing phosphohydrolase [Mobilitalea sp.]|nr:HD domain-containing phosphohydrolase [Mobilitalea sp.]